MILTSIAAANIYSRNNRKEYLDDDNQPKPPSAGALAFVLILFLLELAMAIFALILAWKCGARHKDRIVHLVAAFFFPLFYIIYYFVSGCGNFDGCGVDLAPGAKDV